MGCSEITRRLVRVSRLHLRITTRVIGCQLVLAWVVHHVAVRSAARAVHGSTRAHSAHVHVAHRSSHAGLLAHIRSVRSTHIHRLSSHAGMRAASAVSAVEELHVLASSWFPAIHVAGHGSSESL